MSVHIRVMRIFKLDLLEFSPRNSLDGYVFLPKACSEYCWLVFHG